MSASRNQRERPLTVPDEESSCLDRLLRRDPGAVITKQARGVTVWGVEH